MSPYSQPDMLLAALDTTQNLPETVVFPMQTRGTRQVERVSASNKLEVTVFPNPASEMVRWVFPEALTKEGGVLKCWNVQGQLCYERRLVDVPLHELDITQWNNGVYTWQWLPVEHTAVSGSFVVIK